MKHTVFHKLAELGQSAWLDNISRTMILEGKIKEMVIIGLRGITSNPTIFDKAVSRSNAYDEQIKKLCREGKASFDIYDELTIKDIQDAADILMPVYEETRGLDGYVSLEIDPRLAYDARKTIEEGRRLYKKVNRANAMYKVPSTKEGFMATEELLASGININITLIFSPEQYVNTANAYLKGIKRYIESGGDAVKVSSVASIFVSRIDTLVDKLIDGLIEKAQTKQEREISHSMRGKAAIANAHIIYKKFREIFSSVEFLELKDKGARLQRPLWGSTSTKDPAYSDIKYVTQLIAKDTVNTMPNATFEAFLNHGSAKEILTEDLQDAPEIIERLKECGIDMNKVCAQLLKDGVVSFKDSFNSLLKSIEEKMKIRCKA